MKGMLSALLLPVAALSPFATRAQSIVKQVLLVPTLLALAAFAPLPARAQAPGGSAYEPAERPIGAALAAQAPLLYAGPGWTVTYVGHSATNHFDAAANWWNVYAGVYQPGVANPANAVWDFDNQTGLAAADSLQGWWPTVFPYRSTMPGLTDDRRPWWCLDYGNVVNAAPIQRGRVRGVVGVWHSDPGAAAGNPLVRWAPLAGARSAWCGLRALHDDAVLDPLTGNPFTEMLAETGGDAAASAGAPTFRCYPGYGSQWDQLLYRDLQPVPGQPLEIAFLYRTRLSTAYATAADTRAGWFHGDPLGPTSAPVYAGNFISSSAAGSNAPRDSFSVYLGLPVDDANCLYADGNTRPVYDPLRRWFDEVIHVFDAPYFELLGVAGCVPADTVGAPAAWDQVVPYDPPAYAGGPALRVLESDPAYHGTLRLVFRVKTNRGSADDDYASGTGVVGGGFTSAGWGAALVDEVAVDGVVLGDFETPGRDIDNRAGVPALAAWKSTGKPPALYFHPVNVDLGPWNDLCGGPGAATSPCSVRGIVASAGNGDYAEIIADPRFESTSECSYGMVSPAIDLVTNADGVTPNPMGITGTMTQATDDWYLRYDVNGSPFVLPATGTTWNFGVQSYPALAANGHACWGDVIRSPYRLYQGADLCEPDVEPLKSRGLVRTSNAGGVPDSVRLYLGVTTEIFAFGAYNSGAGGYFDNIALALVSRPGTSAAGTLSADIWQWFNDAFPVNGLSADLAAPGTAPFDTTTALVKGALNLAPVTGDETRFDVLADSIVVTAPDAGSDPATRVDLVFRILPGPGNYQIAAGRQFPPVSTMKLLKVPTNQAQVAVAGDNSFWGQYLANPGQFSAGTHHGGAWWDYLTWNSARCDTAESNLFPVAGHALPGPYAGAYQSTYHELDPHFETLGIPKNRCFLVDTAGPANSTNLSCDSTAAPAWLTTVPASRTGWNGGYASKEGTKILPDGLLTPGAHVQYFFRRQAADGTGPVALVPDTTTICPQVGESNYDGHRWQQFGVLPDRWKDAGYGGEGSACLLFIDNDDRRGDELTWVSVMDSTCGTASAQWGTHNGWHAMGNGFPLDARRGQDISFSFVADKNHQPGTAWDMYGVKAAEAQQRSGAHIGNRYANQAGMGLLDGRQAAIGPRMSWLRTYYRYIVLLTGDLNGDMIAPFPDASQNDIALLRDFLGTPGGTAQPRCLLVQGNGYAEDAILNDEDGSHTEFLNNWQFCNLRSTGYLELVPVYDRCPDLYAAPAFFPQQPRFSLQNPCSVTQDVLSTDPVESEAITDYAPVGVGGPYHASVLHLPSSSHPWRSVVSGWDMSDTYSYLCMTTLGRRYYYYRLLVSLVVSECPNWGTPWSCLLDVPDELPGEAFTNYLRIANSGASAGSASVLFGCAVAGRVRVSLYDIAGRRIRTLADRVFPAGDDHRLTWDGTDDAGRRLPRGVYFARITYAASGASLAGRVVFLR